MKSRAIRPITLHYTRPRCYTPRLTTERKYIGKMTFPFFTVGHSTRPINEFIELLAASRLASLSMCVPFRVRERIRNTIARRCPDHYRNFRSPMNISRSLAASGRERTILPQRQRLLEKSELSQLRGLRNGRRLPIWLRPVAGIGSVRRCAVMCAEAVWWRCHRRIITDYLLIAGERVFHILGPKAVTPASLTKGATSQRGGVLTYPAF